nr:ribonuclease H-like domain-containing protein [Tanacetum cinerariifolium]
SSKTLNKMLYSQVNDKNKTVVGYHAVLPPYTMNFMPPKPNLILIDMDEYVVSETVTSVPAVATNKAKTSESKPKPVSEPIIRDWVSNSEDENETETKCNQRKPSFAKIEFVKPNDQVKSPRESIKQEEHNKQAKHPRKNSQSPRGNKINWNNLLSQRLGNDFKMLNKACYICGSFEHLQYTCKHNKEQLNGQRVHRPIWNNTRKMNHQNSPRMSNSHPKRNFVPRIVLMRYGFKTLNTARQNSSRVVVSVDTARQINTAYSRLTVNSARPMHMTGNMSYLFEYEEIDGGYVAFGGDHKGGKITGKGKISTDTECVVLCPDFKLLDESQVLLRVPRKDNMYSVDLKNVAPSRGRFDGKADEGFFVGYPVNNNAFRVFNSRTKIVEETLHITFLENKPNIARSGPTWLFDIDTLKNSMNYKPVVTGNQSNGSAGKARVETVPNKDYILLLFWTQDLLSSSSSKDSPGDGFKPSGDEDKKDAGDPRNKDNEVLSTEEPKVNQDKDSNVNITNILNTVSPTNNAAGIKDNVVDENIVYGCADDLNMPHLEEIIYSDDDEDVGAEADMTNLDTNIYVSPIPTTRIHKDHPVKQIIRDIHSTPQTRRMSKSVTDHEPKKMDVKSAFLYGKIEKEIHVCQPPGFEDPEFSDGVYKLQNGMSDENSATLVGAHRLFDYCKVSG